MKRILIGVIEIILIILCSGCNPLSGSGRGLKSSSQAQDTSQPHSIELETSYKLDTDKLKMDVDMIIPDGLKLTKSTAVKVKWVDIVPAIKEKYITDKWKEHIGENADDNGVKTSIYEWWLGDVASYQKSILINPWFVDMDFDRDAIEKEQASFRLSGRENENEDLYATENEFSFGGIEDSLKQSVDEINNNMGVMIGDIEYYNCYSLDADTMKQQEWLVDHDNNKIETGIVWTEDDNYYKFFARQSFQQLPIYYSGSELGIALSNDCMPIQMLVGENGICSLDMERIFTFEEGEEDVSLIDTKDIIEIVKAHYTEALTSTQYVIDNAELMYYAKKNNGNEYTLIPVWIFEVEQSYRHNGMEYSDLEILMLNAQSGDEVMTE